MWSTVWLWLLRIMLLITNEIQKHQSIISKTPLCHPHQNQIHFNDYSQFAIYKPKIYIPIFFPDILQIDCSVWDPTGAVWDIYNTLCNSSPLKHSLKPQKSIILAVICLLSDQYQKKKEKAWKVRFDRENSLCGWEMWWKCSFPPICD